MSGGEEVGLFGGLPEQAGPPAPARPPRLRRAERRQVELRAVSLDELLPAGHRARLVWAFVEKLDLGPLYAAIRAVEGRAGHPPADPRLLLALWLFATVEGVGSARELARLCEEHLAYQWLCGGVGMNHKTLNDFRLGHGAVLERLLVDGFAALLATGVASLDRVAQDGVRVRASAGAASFRRRATLEECRLTAEQRLAALRAELDADPGGASRRQAAARQRAALDRQRRVAAALAIAEQLHQRQEATARRREARAARRKPPAPPAEPAEREPAAEPAREPRVSTTDPEARVMKMADGGFRPAYNVQLATDTASGLIAAVAVDASGSDMGKLAPMSGRLAADYGIRPAEHLADGGFTRLDDITALAEAGSRVYAPPPKPRDPKRDPHAPLPDDPPEIAEWRRRMGTPEGKAIYKHRAATAECANAQLRNRGLIRLLVRGSAKVKAVVLLHALTHNMARLWSLQPA
jgi:transposase